MPVWACHRRYICSKCLAGNFLTSEKASKLTPPVKGKIPVAFAISDGVTVIDFAGPWEVFQDVMMQQRGNDMDDQMPFELFTVSEKTEVLAGSAGLKLVPDYTFDSAPQPKVIVVPAQRGSQALHAWLRKMSTSTDVIMSVCTGAFQLGKAGLLTGKDATTHHDFFDQFAKAFPDVGLKRGLRFVENEKNLDCRWFNFRNRSRIARSRKILRPRSGPDHGDLHGIPEQGLDCVSLVAKYKR